MRDEAREHVLAIKSSDIVLNRLLGSGSFAEVPEKSPVKRALLMAERALIVGLFCEELLCVSWRCFRFSLFFYEREVDSLFFYERERPHAYCLRSLLTD